MLLNPKGLPQDHLDSTQSEIPIRLHYITLHYYGILQLALYTHMQICTHTNASLGKKHYASKANVTWENRQTNSSCYSSSGPCCSSLGQGPLQWVPWHAQGVHWDQNVHTRSHLTRRISMVSITTLHSLPYLDNEIHQTHSMDLHFTQVMLSHTIPPFLVLTAFAHCIFSVLECRASHIISYNKYHMKMAVWTHTGIQICNIKSNPNTNKYYLHSLCYVIRFIVGSTICTQTPKKIQMPTL